MSERVDQNRRVEIVELGEKRFVGVASTSSHQDVRGITVASRVFMERKTRSTP